MAIKNLFFLLLGLSLAPCLYANNTVSVIGVGDIMLGTNFPNDSYLPPNNGKDLLQEVNHILRQADVTFGNLEGVVLNQGGEVKKCQDPTKCYAFRMPESLVSNLKLAGFDVLNLANNHSNDFGSIGMKNTIAALSKFKIASAGLLIKPTAVFKRNGVRYGLAGFAPNKGTVGFHNIKTVKKIVSRLAKKVDIVIVSFHGGAEGAKHQHITRKTETFYGENRGNVYKFAHAVIDAGADVVFGHGPHVVRAVELYKNRFIAYSLGNFCTYGRFNLSGLAGIAPIIKVKMTKSGEFVNAQIIAAKQHGLGGSKLDKNNRAIKKIQNLTKTDFPKTNLQIADNGLITKK